MFNVLVFVILVMPPEGGQLSCETNFIFTFVTPIQLQLSIVNTMCAKKKNFFRETCKFVSLPK